MYLERAHVESSLWPRAGPPLALFETTASPLDSARASLAPPGCLDLHVFCVSALRASEARMELEAGRIQAEAGVLKRA